MSKRWWRSQWNKRIRAQLTEWTQWFHKWVKFASRRTSGLIKQWDSTSTHHWINETMIRQLIRNQRISESTSQCLSDSVSQETNVNQWITESRSQWINDSTIQCVNESYEPVNQRIDESANQWANRALAPVCRFYRPHLAKVDRMWQASTNLKCKPSPRYSPVHFSSRRKTAKTETLATPGITLPGKKRFPGRECFHPWILRSRTASLRSYLMMGGWHDDVVDMMMWLTGLWKWWPWQPSVTQKFCD